MITLANIRHFINFKMLYHLKNLMFVYLLFFSVCLGFFSRSKAFQKLLVGTKENHNDDGDKIVNCETTALHMHFVSIPCKRTR